MKKPKPYKSKRARRMNLIGSSLAWIVLLILWITCLSNLLKGNLFGYKNYYGQPVGTLLLLSVLIIVTPIAGYATWKSYKGELPKERKGKTKKEKQINRGESKWPWEIE